MDITATVFAANGGVGRLKVLSCDDLSARDLVAAAAEVATWPVGPVAIDISLRRGSIAGRLDTFFIGIAA